ncbi:hypothetical protein JTB14_025073 [Gonioctena quinquepunctata]|nr:hypothetical protein JTB14_025073 [Gonioctena quinquepunctata]
MRKEMLMEVSSENSNEYENKLIAKLVGIHTSKKELLRPEDQATNKILVKHLKSARVNNYQAHIKNHKLYVNGTPYTPKELEDGDKESEAELLPKANSAPPTPSTSHKKDSKKDPLKIQKFSKSDRHRGTSKGREP